METLLVCECKNGPKVDANRINSLKHVLDKKHIKYTLAQDLCGLVARQAKQHFGFHTNSKNIVLACKPKAIKNLLNETVQSEPCINLECKEINTFPVESLNNYCFETGEPTVITYSNDWKPWFPVLDYELCTHCQKCLNFCLFGVYQLNKQGKVTVANPDKCKDLCPACARTCPTSAIVFPKHHESPIDGGKAEFTNTAGSMLDAVQQSDDVYQLLANRRKASGISLLKTNQMKIAEEERKKFKNDK